MQNHALPTTPDTRPPVDIPTMIQRCLEYENRNLSVNSLKELQRYFKEFVSYCTDQGISQPGELTPEFLKIFLDHRCRDVGPTTKKAVVWSLRKLGRFMALLQVVKRDPAMDLRHPEIHPRSELPAYLCENDLRKLMEYVSRQDYQEFTIISLMTVTGLRPSEIARLKRDDLNLVEHHFSVQVKGGWIKKSPLSKAMVTVLNTFLSIRVDGVDSLFINSRGNPVSVSWLQKMVKRMGNGAGLSVSLTCNHLRHTFATHAADRQGKVITKALMGHRFIATTEIYTHLSPRKFKAFKLSHPYNSSKERSRT